MTSDRPSTEAAYARTLLPLARMWRAAADRALSGLGLSAAGGWALIEVGRLGGDVRQSDLAAKLDVRAASLVRVVDRLAEAGLVSRRGDPADGRVSRIGLTDRGRALVERIEAALAELRSETLADIPGDDLETALRVARLLEARFAASLVQ
jgi:MarR family transcriptional regulator for hemolysin